MLDVFSPLQPDQQRAHHAAFRQFLSERDGTPDIERRTLSRREERMARFERPLTRVRELDRARFKQQYARFDVKRHALSQEAVLLMALLRINAAEAYGVSRVFDDCYRRAKRNGDDLEMLVLLEESYHTRILLSSATLYGLDIDEACTPQLVQRGFLNGIAKAPESVSRPLALAGEVLGTAMFLKVLLAARRILAHDPELRDAIEERVMDVLIDEIGHISFNRILLSPAGMRHAKLILRPLSMGLMRVAPELGALGLEMTYDDASFVTTCSAMPEQVRKAAFVV